jgi:hypothetical protein
MGGYHIIKNFKQRIVRIVTGLSAILSAVKRWGLSAVKQIVKQLIVLGITRLGIIQHLKGGIYAYSGGCKCG